MNAAEFSREVERTIQVYEGLIGEYAGRTRAMVEQHGPVQALERLVVSGDLQRGFRVLRDRGRLRDSFEQLVTDNHHLFSEKAVEAAQWRLAHAEQL